MIMDKTKKIVLSGLLLAVLIIAARFLSFKSGIVVISFSYVPIIIAAFVLGPEWSCIIAGLGDLIGALLFPFGAYFPGYTVSAMLTGLIYGFFLYNTKTDKGFAVRLSISSFLVLALVHTGITTLWVLYTSGKAFSVIMPARVATAVAMLPVQISTMILLKKSLEKPIERFLKD